MSAGRPRAAAGASARKATDSGAPERGRPEDKPLVGVEPRKDRSKQGQTCGTGSARHPRRDALCSFESTPHPGSLSCEFPSCHRNPLSRKGSEQSSNGPDKKSREIRLTWERVGRILQKGRATGSPQRRSRVRWNPVRASRCGARCAASCCPSSGGPVAPPRTPIWASRPGRHPRKRRQPSRSLRGAASQRRLFPFPAPVSDQHQERSFR